MCAGHKRGSDPRTPCLEQAIHFPQFRRTGYNILGAVQVPDLSSYHNFLNENLIAHPILTLLRLSSHLEGWHLVAEP